ncbi:hypothetical protein Tco_0725539 [Tanacetum coccineum]|uniref:Uncharacterized protein n=1 Tax=Tanacetum coccineum TaxID=301880 RepID=A0ABQ4YDA5_9ASTR
MVNKDNYVPWSSRLLCYAKIKPNRKLIYNFIMHGPYVRRMILKPSDPDREVPVAETFHEQTNDKLTDKEEKKAKLFNEFERFTSTDGESIESYYHRFSKLMNDFKRNKVFPEKIANNLKFLNNLQPEWRRHVTIVHQTKDFHIADNTQLYDFLKFNQVEITQPGMNMGQNRQMQMVGGVMVGISLDSMLGRMLGIRMDGSAEVHHSKNCYDNDIFIMFTQEEQYTELLEPISEPHQVKQNDSNVIFAVFSVEQSGGAVEQNHATIEETHDLYDSLYNNLAIQVEKVNKKQQSLYNGKVLLEKHDPPVVYDSEETLQLAQETKFVRDFKSLTKEADESLANHNALEYEIERLLRVVANLDIISIMQNPTVVETSDLQTELERTKERFENCIIKKKNEYAKLWNDWYKKCEECKYEKVLYDKAYNEMQQKSERLQAQLGDLKGKSKDTPCVSDTLDPLSQKIEDENVSLMWTLSLKKILGAENPEDMITKVVTTEKIPCVESILALRLVSAAYSVCLAVQEEGSRLRAEGSNVDLIKRIRGRTLLMQKLLRILLLSRAEED